MSLLLAAVAVAVAVAAAAAAATRIHPASLSLASSLGYTSFLSLLFV